ncbi:hypothetical protein D3C79_863690 [compost metagenome]
MDRLATQAPAFVITCACDQAALGAHDFVMHGITLKVADDPAVQIDLVQVPTAVVEVIEIALVGEGEGLQVAQVVVAVLQQPGAVSFAQQLPCGVVAVLKLLPFTLIIGESDG